VPRLFLRECDGNHKSRPTEAAVLMLKPNNEALTEAAKFEGVQREKAR
jgi:hypothetical protein